MIYQNYRPVFLSLLFTTVLFLSISSSSAADPIVTEITLNPIDPAPLGTITFNISLESDEPPTNIYIVVQECKADICFKDGYNESMALLDTGVYQADVELGRDDATYIKYHVEMLVDGIWFSNEITELDLNLETGNGDPNGGNSDNGDNGTNDNTPGFELLAFLIAAGIIIIAFRRKRSR